MKNLRTPAVGPYPWRNAGPQGIPKQWESHIPVPMSGGTIAPGEVATHRLAPYSEHQYDIVLPVLQNTEKLLGYLKSKFLAGGMPELRMPGGH